MKGSLPIIATDEMWDNVIKPGTKDLHMHLWGVMRYKDVFGDEQTERFRFSNWIQSVKEATQQYGSMRYPVVSLFGWENDRETEDQSQNQNPT